MFLFYDVLIFIINNDTINLIYKLKVQNKINEGQSKYKNKIK